MSCRKAITEIRDAVVAELIEHPNRGGIKTQADAEKAIFETPWWIAVLPNIGPTRRGRGSKRACSYITHRTPRCSETVSGGRTSRAKKCSATWPLAFGRGSGPPELTLTSSSR